MAPEADVADGDQHRGTVSDTGGSTIDLAGSTVSGGTVTDSGTSSLGQQRSRHPELVGARSNR